MKNILILLMITIMSACDVSTRDYIIVVQGASHNPSVPRRAIEVNSKQLFFCKEQITGEFRESDPSYSYHKGALESSDFESIQRLIEKHFQDIDKNGELVDYTVYQLIYKFENQQDSILISSGHLTPEQHMVLDSILSLGHLATEEIEFHDFPSELLFEKLDMTPFSNVPE